MSAESNRWFRTMGEWFRSDRPSPRHDTRYRRLVLEHVENRLLLSVTMQSTIEQNLPESSSTWSYIAIDNTATPLAGDGPNVLRYRDTVRDSGSTMRNCGANVPTIAFVGIPDNVFPNSIGKGGLIDISSLANNAICSSGATFLSQNQNISLQGAIEERPANTSKTSSIPIGVDGTCGRCQAFDLANGRELKSDVVRLTQEVAEESRLHSRQVVGPDSEMARLEPSRKETQHPQEPAAVQMSNRLAGDVTAQEKPFEALPRVRANVSFLTAASQTISSKPVAYGEEQNPSMSSPTQAANRAEAERRAVFDKMLEDSERDEMLPAYLDNHRTVLAGLAVATFAGPCLTRRWWRRVDPAQTCLLPPRRRASAD